MTIRRLEAEEMPEKCDPEYTICVGAFDDGKLVGWAYISAAPLLEDPWIEPRYRGGTLCRRLHDEVERICRRYGLPRMVALTLDEKHGDYLRRLGYKPVAVAWEKDYGKTKEDHRNHPEVDDHPDSLPAEVEASRSAVG